LKHVSSQSEGSEKQTERRFIHGDPVQQLVSISLPAAGSVRPHR
jgi:hypothetical protein